MQQTSLALLWHMHQPYYRNMITGECIQPWVRLHGIHSYYDMMKLYEANPDICTNINFAPSLLKQLREYVEDGLSDKFCDVSKIDAKELTQDQKMFLLRNFFMANTETMIEPHPRYAKLYQRRGKDMAKIDFENAIRYFSWKDYLDIQIYYNLCWFGFKAREEYPEIEKMLSIASAGHVFTEDDKKFVLVTQSEILKKLLYSIRNTPPNIELTTTPFFHPILPLLIDTNIAGRAMPKAHLPPKFSMPKLAKFQVEHGLAYFERSTGKKAAGMWPAEGSVCPEMIPILENAGVKWIATDEGILPHGESPYQPYLAEHENSKVAVFFRDRGLSDLIGFSYSRMNAEQASEDLVNKVLNVSKQTTVQNPIMTILLDGENPWEAYEENGKKFLNGMMEKIRKANIKTTTLSRYLEKHPPQNKISNIHSGSWINANYGIWIGKPQKNQAWEYIKRTNDELGSKLSNTIDDENRSGDELKALESFCAGCGSDWFWWFDDDFESEFKSDFDKIFRMHLKNTFSLFGKDMPMFLFEPIHHYKEPLQSSHGLVEPPAFINPTVDGIDTSFFEWTNAVKLDVGKHRGPMGQTEELFETIYFGFDLENFYVRLAPLNKNITFNLENDEEVAIYVHDGSAKYKLRLFFDGKRYQMKFVDSPEEGFKNGSHRVKWAVKSVFEMGLSFSDLGFKSGEEVTVIITVVRGNVEVRHYSHIVFNVPDENYERMMWSV